VGAVRLSGRTNRRHRVRILTLLAVLVGGIGCRGGSETDGPEQLTHGQYQQALHEIQASADIEQANRLFTELVVGPLPKDECAATAADFHRALVSILEQVRPLVPPDDARDAHRDFLAAAATSVEQIGGLAEAVARGELRCGADYNSHAYRLPSTEVANRAILALCANGYRLGLCPEG
jgi:hypothetical protein